MWNKRQRNNGHKWHPIWHSREGVWCEECAGRVLACADNRGRRTLVVIHGEEAWQTASEAIKGRGPLPC